MSLIRWSPMPDPFSEIEEMMGNFPAISEKANMQNAFVPAMDVYDTKDAVVVETPLAGVRPEEVDVSVDKGVLTVRGQSKKEHEVDEKNYYRKEVRAGSFFRQVSLPCAVKENSVKAELENGILKIVCPKAEQEKTKKISIKVVKKDKK